MWVWYSALFTQNLTLWQGTTSRQVSGPTLSLPSASSVHVCHASGRSSKELEAFSRPTRKARRQHWRSRRTVQNSRPIHTGPWTERKPVRTVAQKLRLFRPTTGPRIKLGSILRAATYRKMEWNPQLLLRMLLAWRAMSISRRPILVNSIPSCGDARGKVTRHPIALICIACLSFCLHATKGHCQQDLVICDDLFLRRFYFWRIYIYSWWRAEDSSRPEFWKGGEGEDGFFKGWPVGNLGWIKCFYALCWEIVHISYMYLQYNGDFLSD